MFLSGNILFMSVLTILFALTFLATWKAPAWVRNVAASQHPLDCFSACLA